MSQITRKGEAPIAGNAILTVTKKNYLTPNYVRITLTGTDVHLFKDCTIGMNNKIFIPQAGANEIHFPIFDPEARCFRWPETADYPTVRTFTHRGIDLGKNELYLEFALHGNKRTASSWASSSKIGDKLHVAMWVNRPEKLYVPADWYLLAGDASAIPVISVILETLPEDATGLVYFEVGGPEDAMELKKPAGMQVEWIYNLNIGIESLLPEKIRAVLIPENVSRFSYVAAEDSAVRDIRNYLKKELNWTKNETHAYAYWKAGCLEDQVESELNETQSAD